MSGSGGSDFEPMGVSGGGTGVGSDDCAQLQFETSLASPDPAAVANLAVGDVLTIELIEEPVRSVAAKKDGQIVGAITDHLNRLVDCLQRGVPFVALVLSIVGGAIDVDVHAGP